MKFVSFILQIHNRHSKSLLGSTNLRIFRLFWNINIVSFLTFFTSLGFMSGVFGPSLTSESSDGRRQRAVGNINYTLALFIRSESVWLQQLKVSCHHFSLRNFWIPPVEIPAAVSPFIDLVKLAGSCPMLKHVSYKQFSWIFVFSNIVCYVDRLTFQLDSTATANVFCVFNIDRVGCCGNCYSQFQE